jgi:multidrug efflux pump subunit AcrA (membrane-fusion protein)
VLAISSADKVVTFNLPAADQDIIAIGDAIVVELPDGRDVPGTVTDIATVATVSQDGNATFEVTIALDDPTVASGLDEAPVDIEIIADSVQNVVAVPVASLVALSEGGYAVEVDTGNGTTKLVAVDPGFYADSMVEVTSTELQPGDQVVIP